MQSSPLTLPLNRFTLQHGYRTEINSAVDVTVLDSDGEHLNIRLHLRFPTGDTAILLNNVSIPLEMIPAGHTSVRHWIRQNNVERLREYATSLVSNVLICDDEADNGTVQFIVSFRVVQEDGKAPNLFKRTTSIHGHQLVGFFITGSGKNALETVPSEESSADVE